MKIKQYKAFEDERGSLLPIEFWNLSFQPKRIFIVNNVPLNDIRGEHAHYKTKQLIICINGKIKVILHDGKEQKEYALNKNESILVPELIWDSQQFLTEDAEILVICSTEYNVNDYIFDFDKFIKIVN